MSTWYLRRHFILWGLSEKAVTKFKESIPLSFSSVPCAETTEGSYLNFTPKQLDDFVYRATALIHTTLDNVDLLKKKVIRKNRLAPWFNSELLALKYTARKLERKWC